MGCEPFDLGGGMTGFICSRGGRRSKCQKPNCDGTTTALCDFPLSGAKAGKTCSRRMCARHQTKVGPDLDHCPTHAAMGLCTTIAVGATLNVQHARLNFNSFTDGKSLTR